MEFKGTKGKWRITQENEVGILISGFNPVSDILTVHRYGFTKEENANALLISKAPEMLEMLKDIKDCLGSDKREQVEQLIKEATEF
jgi:hypothetical protein